MSIAPPSDIIMDVAQAADPQRLQAATAKLAQMAAGGSPVDFDTVLSAAATPARSVTPKPTVNTAMIDDRPSRITRATTSPYQKFEAMVLQNFVASMLPRDNDLYGDAASADAYRSMMADQLAQQLAKTGRIGIAASIEKAHAGHNLGPTPMSMELASRGFHVPGTVPFHATGLNARRITHGAGADA